MWRRADSNRRPPACKAGALPAELHPRPVGIGRFELPTSRLSGVRSNQLSYMPESTFHRETQNSVPSVFGKRTVSLSGGRWGVLQLKMVFPRRERSTWSMLLGLLRKEVIQPQLPLRLPCYDFVPVTSPTFDSSLPCGLSHWLRVLPASIT